MTWVDIACVAFGVVGWAYAVKCYRELFKWARQCQRARIAVAYKEKVRLEGPLVEWLGWCNALDKDKESRGRVVYRMGGTSVAVIKGVKPVGKTRQAVASAKRRRANAAPKTGKWSATDQTKHAK